MCQWSFLILRLKPTHQYLFHCSHLYSPPKQIRPKARSVDLMLQLSQIDQSMRWCWKTRASLSFIRIHRQPLIWRSQKFIKVSRIQITPLLY